MKRRNGCRRPFSMRTGWCADKSEVRRSGQLPWLRPDAKSQVTFLYRDGLPVAIQSIVLSTQHDESIGYDELRNAVQQ